MTSNRPRGPDRKQFHCRSVLLGVLDTSGYFGSLVVGFRSIGCRAELLHLGAAKSLNWDPSHLSLVPKLYYRAYQAFHRSRKAPRLSLFRLAATAWLLFAQCLLLLWIALRIDALVLKSGESLTSSGWELAVLRWLGKRILFFYQGSDSRPPYLAGMEAGQIDVAALNARTIEIYERLKAAERHADFVVANPLSAQFHEGRICIAQMIGNTIDEAKAKPGLDYLASEQSMLDRSAQSALGIRVLHAPSDPALKGTDRIRDAIAQLKSRGHAIDYVEVTGRPNAEVMVELARCDIVIDELYSDSHGGLLALEACAFGRPVLVGGYGADELSRLIHKSGEVPTAFCHPDELIPVLERMVTDATYRAELGRRAREYFENSRPACVAARLRRVLEGEAPESWFVDAADLRYVEGVAGSAHHVRANIQRLISTYGVESLRLGAKPALATRMLAFAAEEGLSEQNVIRN